MASVFIALLVLIGLFVAALAVPIINQTNHLQEAAPGYVDKLKKDPTVNDLNERYQLVSKASAAAGKLPEKVVGAADKLVTGVAETITAIFLTLFLMLELPTLSAGVLLLLPEKRAERVSRLAVDVQPPGGWLRDWKPGDLGDRGARNRNLTVDSGSALRRRAGHPDGRL